jgi:hypothetical protein
LNFEKDAQARHSPTGGYKTPPFHHPITNPLQATSTMAAGESPNVADMAMSAALNLPPSALSIAAGYAAFASSMALSTFLQLKLLGVSTGSPRPIPSLLGIASVALSSLASHKASVKVYSEQHDLSLATSSRDMIHFGAIQVDKHTLRM